MSRDGSRTVFNPRTLTKKRTATEDKPYNWLTSTQSPASVGKHAEGDAILIDSLTALHARGVTSNSTKSHFKDRPLPAVLMGKRLIVVKINYRPKDKGGGVASFMTRIHPDSIAELKADGHLEVVAGKLPASWALAFENSRNESGFCARKCKREMEASFGEATPNADGGSSTWNGCQLPESVACHGLTSEGLKGMEPDGQDQKTGRSTHCNNKRKGTKKKNTCALTLKACPRKGMFTQELADGDVKVGLLHVQCSRIQLIHTEHTSGHVHPVSPEEVGS
jgi:hypothetical protein